MAGTRVVTGEVRLCWPNLFEPKAINEKSDPKYSTMILVKKTDTKTVEALRNAEKAAATEQAGKWMGKSQNKPSVIKDADEDGKAEEYPERKGCLYMTVSANADYPPDVVDKQVNKVLDRSEVYSGVYARVSVAAFAYNFEGNRGIGFGLNNVQVLGKGDSLLGGVSAEVDFEPVDDEEASLL